MPSLLVASAFVPAFCEEAIRSSYLYYLSDRGKRRLAVISVGAVFVIGEIAYDLSLFPDAIAELGFDTALSLLVVALISGAFLHVALTIWTARGQANGFGAWKMFAMALGFHSAFNLVAIATMTGVL